MKPDAEYKRKLAYIESPQDRFLVGRDSWNERDWKAQRKLEAEQRARKADLLANLDRLDRPVVDLPTPTVAGFSLSDRTRDDERRRRLAANRELEKAGLRPRLRW